MSQQTELTLTKLEIAEHQLNRALALFLEESDFVSAITLAGASEEILGELLKQQNQIHALSALVETSVEIARVTQNRTANPKHFAELANRFRNGLKHITDGKPMTISRRAAIEILTRAVENYFALTGWLSPSMEDFLRAAYT